jgi:hypothetical protein
VFLYFIGVWQKFLPIHTKSEFLCYNDTIGNFTERGVIFGKHIFAYFNSRRVVFLFIKSRKPYQQMVCRIRNDCFDGRDKRSVVISSAAVDSTRMRRCNSRTYLHGRLFGYDLGIVFVRHARRVNYEPIFLRAEQHDPKIIIRFQINRMASGCRADFHL